MKSREKVLRKLEERSAPCMHASPRQEGHTMLNVIEHTATPSLIQRAQLHAVDFIDRNLMVMQIALLVATGFFSVVMVAAIVLRVF